jgi:hypothetical protein
MINVKRVVPWEKIAEKPKAPPARPLTTYNAKINLTVRREGVSMVSPSVSRGAQPLLL